MRSAIAPTTPEAEVGRPGTAAAAAPDAAPIEGDRPSGILPIGHLLRISAYWLGLTSVMTGLMAIVNARLQFAGLTDKGGEGAASFEISIVGWFIAITMQPTVGSISDYTITRWGRRKPYIVIGSALDLVFLYGIATSNTVPALAAFVALLQFSSNFAQGPFQGYVPDLVPEKQVGLASGLMGMFSTLGNVTGFLVGAIAVIWSKSDPNAYLYGLMALGAIEFTTMLSVVIRVDEGRQAKPREGRSWTTIARQVWATDILQERSFVWLVLSRLFILVAGSLLTQLNTFYLAQTFGMDEEAAGTTTIVLLGLVTAGTLLSVVPASRLSDRIGRKPVIYGSCAIGAAGLAIVASAPVIPLAMAGVVLFAISAGSFMAVDWALMTDVVPKASAGRYMGISNLATASCGQIAVLVGGALVMDTVNRAVGYGAGPRAAIMLGVLAFGLGALMLRPVREPIRRRARTEAVSAVA